MYSDWWFTLGAGAVFFQSTSKVIDTHLLLDYGNIDIKRTNLVQLRDYLSPVPSIILQMSADNCKI